MADPPMRPPDKPGTDCARAAATSLVDRSTTMATPMLVSRPLQSARRKTCSLRRGLRGRPARLGRAGAAGVLMVVLTPGAGAREAAPVQVTTAERAPVVREVALSGTLTSPRRARLAPEVDGRVTAIGVDSGARVAAGDELLQLDTELVELERDQARAAVREAQADLTDAQRRLREGERLAERGNIGRSDLESRRAEVEHLEAVVARRRAEAGYQEALLRRHRLTAPFAGVINQRLVALGERAGPDDPVFELVAVERLELDLAVPQRYFASVSPGTPVRIRVDASARGAFDATVDEVIPVASADSRTFRVRTRIDNADGALAPGMSAKGTLRIDTGREEVVIPRDGLIRQPNGRTVVWVVRDGDDGPVVEERRVETGLQFDGRVAVVEGLEADATVVTEGNEALQNEQRVRITGRE